MSSSRVKGLGKPAGFEGLMRKQDAEGASAEFA